MSSTNPFKPLGAFKGGRTRKTYRLFWHAENHYIYVERPGFFSTTKEKTRQWATSGEAAYHAAEAMMFDW